MDRKPVVVVLHGPSGAGKDTVIDRLREKTGIHRATSSTSRHPRPGEIDGVSYYFLRAAEFEAKIHAGEFAEYARVYDDWKGVEKRELLPYLDKGIDVIIRTDVQGARTWRNRLAGAVFVFLAAEDRDVLRTRLIERNTEDGRSLAIRMEELEKELEDMPNNDYVVFNRDGRLDETVCEVEQIIERERVNPDRPLPHLVA
jgi:guanylate kinase